MNSSVTAHGANCELQAILQKLEWCRQITHCEIGRKPMDVIQEALAFIHDNEKLKNRIMIFEETYIHDNLVNLNMVELLEQEGETYVNNMINSLKALVCEIIIAKT